MMFSSPVSIPKSLKIDECLALVEKISVILAKWLALPVVESASKPGTINQQEYVAWTDLYQSQIVVLAAQICRSEYMEAALQTMANTDLYACIQPLEAVLKSAEQTLTMLADFMVQKQPLLQLKTLEHLLSTAAKLHSVTQFVYKRDMARFLLESSINGPRDSRWLSQVNFCFVSRQPVVLRQLSVHMTNVPFSKGVEHLCVQDKPVKTPLTNRCCLTMTQTLEARPAGLPFAVQGITCQQRVELRSVNNSPLPVKTTSEVICPLLGEPTNDWRANSSVLSGPFNTIAKFATDNINDSCPSASTRLHKSVRLWPTKTASCATMVIRSTAILLLVCTLVGEAAPVSANDTHTGETDVFLGSLDSYIHGILQKIYAAMTDAMTLQGFSHDSEKDVTLLVINLANAVASLLFGCGVSLFAVGVLPRLGFTKQGIKPGTTAAWAHSKWHTPVPFWLSLLQRLGMMGVSTKVRLAIFVVSAGYMWLILYEAPV